MSQQRAQRVGGEIQREVARLIRDQLKDPRLGFVTVTDVEASNDLRHAKIFISVLGDDEVRKNSLKALNSASGFIRSELARVVQLRFMPELSFQFDESIERGARISQLLNEVDRGEAHE